MKTVETVKDFNAVKMMRDTRDKISIEIKDMSFEELRAYIDAKLAKKSGLMGEK